MTAAPAVERLDATSRPATCAFIAQVTESTDLLAAFPPAFSLPLLESSLPQAASSVGTARTALAVAARESACRRVRTELTGRSKSLISTPYDGRTLNASEHGSHSDDVEGFS
jgi:hypothetical protein